MRITKSYFTSVLVTYFLLMLVPSLVILMMFDMDISYVSVFLQIPAYVLVFTVYRKIWPSIRNQLQQKVSMSIKTLGIYIACFIILFTLTYLFGEILRSDNYEEQHNNLQLETSFQTDAITPINVVYYLCLILFIPFLEELFFRGFLYTYIAERKGWIIGLLVTSFIFGILHSGAFFFAFCISAINILLLRYTGSLRTPIYFHSIWNAINLLLLGLQ